MSSPCNCVSLLYVDDEPGLLDLCKLFLEREGEFTVFTVTSAKEALETLAKVRFEAIISDYQMPEMDGIEFLKSIRSRYPDLPFIIFTGKGREEVVIQAIDAGADYYVQKGKDIRSQFRELTYKIKLAVEKRRVDKALTASEERFRSVVEDQTEFICRFGPDGTHNFVNDAYCRYFGMQREEIIGKRFLPKIPEEDRELFRSHFASLTQDNPVGTIEHRLILPDGSVRWNQWSDRAIFDDSGAFVEYQSVGRDITELKQAEDELIRKNNELLAAYQQLSATEEELRQNYVEISRKEHELRVSEELYCNVVEDQTEFICRFTPDGKLTFVNDAYCRYFGLDKSSCIGAPQSVVIPRDDLQVMKQHLKALTPENPGATIEHRIIMSSGDIRWQQWTDRAICDAKGNIIEYQSVGHDITHRKTAELDLMKKNDELHAAYEQLAAVEEELRSGYDDLAKSQRTLEDKEITLNAIVQESPIPQFVIDRNHKILYWNYALATQSGIAANEVIGTDQHWRAFYPSKRPCLADLLVDNALDKIPEWYMDKYAKSNLITDAYEATDFFPRIGTEGKWLHFTAGLIKNRNGDIIGAVESLEDITERKTAEPDLRKKVMTFVRHLNNVHVRKNSETTMMNWWMLLHLRLMPHLVEISKKLLAHQKLSKYYGCDI